MARFKTFANSGTLVPDDLNRLSTEIDGSMSSWRTITELALEFASSDVTGNKLYFVTSGLGFETVRVGALWLCTALVNFYINPQQLYRNRRGEMRIRVAAFANSVDNGVNTTTMGVYTMAAYTVSPGGTPQLYFSNEPLPGSILDIGKVMDGSPVLASSAAFPIPQPGHYGVGVRTSANRNPNSEVMMSIQVQYRTSRL